MSTQKLVTVAIAAYNQSKYLRGAIESVLTQTYRNYEIVIADDGSEDGTPDVANGLIAEYSNEKIKYLRQENSGVAVARNHAIANANGEYILPLDADDLMHPEMLEKTVNVLEKNSEIGIAYTDYVFFGDLYQLVPTEEYDLRQFLENKNLFTSSAMYRREAWEKTGGYNPNMIWGFEDWEYWINCGKHGYYGKRVPGYYFYYRAKLNSFTRNKSANRHSNWLFARMALNHPELYTSQRQKWARDNWVQALEHIFDQNDHRGLQYIGNLSAQSIVAETELVRNAGGHELERKMYKRWLSGNSKANEYAVYFNLGVCEEKMGNIADALVAYQASAERNPNFSGSAQAIKKLLNVR
jgi:GT2 family glycosyltransferase